MASHASAALKDRDVELTSSTVTFLQASCEDRLPPSFLSSSLAFAELGHSSGPPLWACYPVPLHQILPMALSGRR